MKHWHWQTAHYKRNFGDELGLWILQRLYPGKFKRTMDERDAEIVSIGSILDARMPDKELIVWGTGGANPYSKSPASKYKWLAVRGELTRRHYGLPETVPLGDPAVLLPLLYEPTPVETGSKVYVPHLHWYKNPTPEWADEVVRPDLPIEEFVDKIASAQFVVSSAMHPYWVARLYNVPCVPLHLEIDNFYSKWIDFESAFAGKTLLEVQLGLIEAIESHFGESTLHHLVSQRQR